MMACYHTYVLEDILCQRQWVFRVHNNLPNTPDSNNACYAVWPMTIMYSSSLFTSTSLPGDHKACCDHG